MARARLVLVACALLQACTCYTLPHASAPAQHRRLRRAAPSMMADDVKVTIKPKAAAAAAPAPAAVTEEAKVTVRVRSPSERTGNAADEAPVADTAVSTSIKVNKPAPKVVEAPPPAPARPFEEELLLNGTQSANCTKILEALQMGANPNVRDPKGRTPLHFMAGVGLAPAVVLLVHFGAQVDAQDNDGLTPLHMAAGYANARSLKVLVAAGADIELTGDGQGTPFDVVKGLGEYQYNQVFGENKKKPNRFNKKDEKLQKLKQCVDVLMDPQKCVEENKWDALLEETMKVISL